MARQFAPKHFLRMAPNYYLAEYFKRRNLLDEIVFDSRQETDIDDVYDAWQALPSQQRAQVDLDFSEIDSLATDEGVATLIREAKYLGVGLAEEFSRDGGYHDKAFDVSLNHAELFERALHLAGAENRPQKYWHKRNDLPDLRVPTDKDTMGTLGSTLRYYFREAEGRGHVCVVEPCQREGAVYFFCYLEDFGRADLSFGDEDELQRLAKRPAFEVIFVVSDERHSLDVFYEGSAKTTRTLEKLFTRVVFGFDLPELRDQTVYELNPLKDRGFEFKHDLSLGIVGVAVKHIRFAAIGGIKRRLTLEADPSDTHLAVYDFMDEVFDTSGASTPASEKLPLAAFNIIQARLQTTFHPRPRRKRPTTTFNVSYPNGCTLGHEGTDAALREMLRQSGIEKVPGTSSQRGLVGRPSNSG